MIRRPPRSTLSSSSAASDVYKRQTYTVQAGDSLSKVAEHTGVNVATLKALNGLSATDLIVTGQTLALKAVPAATAPTVTAAEQAQDLTYIAAADANKDSFMSLDEYNTFKANGGDVNQTAAKPVETVTVPENVAYIAAADTNKDGFMSAAEYQAYQANGGAAAAAAQPQQAAPAAASVPENVTYIAAADTNKDGFMSAAEYQAYKANGGATATPAQPAARVTNVSTQQAASPVASSAVQTILNSLNAKRAALGLAPVRLDAGLSARAQARAQNAVDNGGLPVNHFGTNGEVVAIGWSAGTVINAWYNETNMTTNGTPGHKMWVANARASAVGFGIVGNTIVGVSDAGQY